MSTKRIIILGGSGFLGQILARHLQGAGYEVVVLSRHSGKQPNGIRQVAWDGDPRTRKLALRISMVLGNSGGVFPVLRRLTRLGLGGKMGNGAQYVSWIHELDFCRAIEWLIGREDLAGPVNVAAPNPLPNREMMVAMRKAIGVPFGLPATAWMLEVGAFFLRTETELILKSRRVVPGRLLEAGFDFQFPEFGSAVDALLARGREN